MVAIILAIISMAAKDALCTFLTIAEAKGRAWLAGWLDAAGDLANIVCTVVGAGSVIKYGLTWHSVAVLGAMTVTSLLGTTLWTKLGRRIKAHDVVVIPSTFRPPDGPKLFPWKVGW